MPISQSHCRTVPGRPAHIHRQTTFYQKPLMSGLRLAMTLRHLATEESFISPQYTLRVGQSTINRIVSQVSDVNIRHCRDEYVGCPTCPEEWKEIEQEFRDRWNVPHATGALDGKNISMRCYRHGGSAYFNYKGFHFLVLLTMDDSEYKFIWYDIAAAGSSSDALIFNYSDLRQKIEDNTIDFPQPSPLRIKSQNQLLHPW